MKMKTIGERAGHFLRIRQWGGGGGVGPSTKRDHTISSVEK